MNAQIENVLANLVPAIAERNHAQEEAFARAVEIIELIENRLVTALDGKKLPGAPNLCPFDYGDFRAWRVRKDDPCEEFSKLGDYEMDQFLTKPSLCLLPSGKFKTVVSGFGEEIYWLEEQPKFVEEDLQKVVDLLGKITPSIIEMLQKQHRRSSEISRLARKLATTE